MSRISLEQVAAAIGKIRAMDLKQKELLTDEIFVEQPYLLASVLVQQRMGSSPETVDFLLHVLLVCYLAMKESGHRWPLISEDEQERQLQRLVASINFSEQLEASLGAAARSDFFDAYPEQPLLAFVMHELGSHFNLKVAPGDLTESGKYAMLAALNLVNCIAYISIPEADT